MLIETVRIWYDDGTYSDNWDDNRDMGVQCVVSYHPDGYRTIDMGLEVYIDPTRQSQTIKYGRWLPAQEFQAILDRALA